MRQYAWVAVSAAFVMGTWASAQGPGPSYPLAPPPNGNPGAYGYPYPVGMPYGNAPRGVPVSSPGGNTMVTRPGVTQRDGNLAPLRAYEDLQPSQPPAKPMPTRLPAPVPYPGVAPSWAAPGAPPFLAAPSPSPFTPPIMPGGGEEFSGSSHPFAPTEAPRDPCLPLDHLETRASLPLKANPYRIDSPNTTPPDRLYRGWLMNLLWRVNHTSAPEAMYHTWVNSEFMRWRVTGAPIRIPLVTGNDDPGTIAALNDPGTRVLFGQGAGSNSDFNTSNGWRVTGGRWFDWDNPLGVEASGFLLENRAKSFRAASAGGADAIVSIPFNATEAFNIVNPAGETSLNAGGAANQVDVLLTTQLWGAEANIAFDAHPQSLFPIRLLTIVGFRYLELKEDLELTDTFFDPVTSGAIVVADRFGARNQFFGGQVGVRGGATLGRWSVEGTAKIAFGNNRQTMNINGNTTVRDDAFGFPSATTNGGVFAQPSNSGSFQQNAFTYVPEGQVKIAYEFNQSIRPFFGYNFLYLSNVLRPGNQLDRNINPTQNAFFVPPGDPGTTALTPLPVFRTSDFWAHGFNVGLELRY